MEMRHPTDQRSQTELLGSSANQVHEAATTREDGGLKTGTRSFKWWVLVSIYSLFLLAGQSVATILGRLYYDKGGNSKWIATLVQPAGFPVIIPFYWLNYHHSLDGAPSSDTSPSLVAVCCVYLFLGVVQAGSCILYSIGLLYLPVSTYSLICASQLAFNAVFSFFLNAQKFTPFIINSLVLLTISSALLVFQNEGGQGPSSKGDKYAVGFICTLAASASYGLMLSLTQLCFEKVLKNETFKTVLDMIVYQSLVASCVVVVGLFASGEWKELRTEMDKFELGRVSYLMTLIWTAVCWQVFSIGAIGLIFEVSSLFSNMISTLGLPLVPLLAIIIFHDKMNGVKIISLLLALWGFVSYIYHHYLDHRRSKTLQVMAS